MQFLPHIVRKEREEMLDRPLWGAIDGFLSSEIFPLEQRELIGLEYFFYPFAELIDIAEWL